LDESKQHYSTYDKELYSLVQALKQWQHHILGKKIIVHIDHHPLIFINSKCNIQEEFHLKGDGYLQQFHLVIKYKKGSTSHMDNLLSRPPP